MEHRTAKAGDGLVHILFYDEKTHSAILRYKPVCGRDGWAFYPLKEWDEHAPTCFTCIAAKE